MKQEWILWLKFQYVWLTLEHYFSTKQIILIHNLRCLLLEIHVHNIFHFWAQGYSVNCACYYLFYYYSLRQEKERKYLSNLVQKFVKILQSIPELGKLL